VSAPGWGAMTEDAMTSREIRYPSFGAGPGARRRRGLAQDLLGGALILVAWLVLWSFFAVAIVEPAARFRSAAADAALRTSSGQEL
jgi:hypothetical protein